MIIFTHPLLFCFFFFKKKGEGGGGGMFMGNSLERGTRSSMRMGVYPADFDTEALFEKYIDIM